ncbi:MAG: ribosome biogenesis GTPase YlqF [Mycoplasmatales bacterium]
MENKKINWYPGHMFKAKKEIQEKLKTIDAVIEVIDARVPIVGHNKMLEELVKNKPKLLLFSKSDLVEEQDLSKYLSYYANLGYQTLNINVHANNTAAKVIKKIEVLCEPIKEKFQNKGINKTLRIMIIGMPNAGKSTLINALAGKKKLVVGNRPGVTKAQAIIKLSNDIELVDTPGILIPKIDTLQQGYTLVLNSLIKDEVVELEEVGFYLLKYLIKYKTQELLKRYPKLEEVAELESMVEPDIMQTEQIYEQISKSIGAYAKQSGVDYNKVSVRLVNDYRQQKFGKIILDELNYED